MATTSKDGSRRANYPLPIPGEVVTRHNDSFASNSGEVPPLKVVWNGNSVNIC